MIPEQVYQKVGRLPFMTLQDGRIFYDFLTRNQLRLGLELGFYHGVSTAYLAGAMQDLSGGRLITIDRATAKALNPNICQVLKDVELSTQVDVFFEARSFTWRLMRMLQEGLSETFDFCYIDGGHSWDDTGFAFCLVERLLAPGGWVIFDDLYYSYQRSASRGSTWVRSLPEEERVEMQVLRVFELLVQTNSNFGQFRRLGGRFGFARKNRLAQEQNPPRELELLIMGLLERAHRDRPFRSLLLRNDAGALDLAGVKGADRLYFEESNSFGPLPTEYQSDGRLRVLVERPHPRQSKVSS
jgi:predicted O-methyltransferase YrrM